MAISLYSSLADRFPADSYRYSVGSSRVMLVRRELDGRLVSVVSLDANASRTLPKR
jgi:hypothetical protein